MSLRGWGRLGSISGKLGFWKIARVLHWRRWRAGHRWSGCFCLIVGLSRCGRSRIQAPLGLQRLLNLLGVAELEVAGLLGDDGALMLGLELGDELGLEPAGLLGV